MCVYHSAFPIFVGSDVPEQCTDEQREVRELQRPAGAELVPPLDIRLVDGEAGDGVPAHGGVSVDVGGVGHQPKLTLHERSSGARRHPALRRQHRQGLHVADQRVPDVAGRGEPNLPRDWPFGDVRERGDDDLRHVDAAQRHVHHQPGVAGGSHLGKHALDPQHHR